MRADARRAARKRQSVIDFLRGRRYTMSVFRHLAERQSLQPYKGVHMTDTTKKRAVVLIPAYKPDERLIDLTRELIV